MSAWRSRAEFTAIGASLLAARPPVSAPLGTATETLPVRFDALEAVPTWMRPADAERAAIARRAALLAMAPTLRQTIDGALLASLAEAVGETALDWALERAPEVAGGGIAPVPAEALETIGLAMMRVALPAELAGYVDPGAGSFAGDPALARWCLEAAAAHGCPA